MESDKIDDFITLTLDFAKAANGGELDPAQQIAVLKHVKEQVGNGAITPVLVDDVVTTLQAGKVQELAASGQDFMAGISVAPSSADQAGLLTPIISKNPLVMVFAFAFGVSVVGTYYEDSLMGAYNYLAGVLMASGDDAETTPQVVPATVDFAGTPDPEDLCKDKDPNLPSAGDLRRWAEGQGHTLQGKGPTGIETWTNSAGDWVLKLKPPGVWDALDPGSKIYRYAARTLDGTGDYFDPTTGQRGTRNQVGHQGFDPCDF